MKLIKGYEDFINESYLGGARAPLYHSSPITNSREILEEDKLKSTVIPGKFWSKQFPAPSTISLTRNKDFIYEDYPVTFIMDGDMLKDRFEIYPFDYFVKTVGAHIKSKSIRTEGEFEFEEVLKAHEIKDLHKYLLAIRANNSLFQYYKNYPRNTREEFRESYEDLIKTLIFYAVKYNVKVVKQNGSEWTLDQMREEAHSEFENIK